MDMSLTIEMLEQQCGHIKRAIAQAAAIRDEHKACFDKCQRDVVETEIKLADIEHSLQILRANQLIVTGGAK